jgi:hypothetical protein
MPFDAKTALPLLAPALLTGLLATASFQTRAAEAPAATPAPQFPLRDFFASPPQGFFRVSDGGRWLSWMQPAVGDGGATPRRNLFVQALDGSKPTGQPRQLTRESARDIANYFWKGSRRTSAAMRTSTSWRSMP